MKANTAENLVEILQAKLFLYVFVYGFIITSLLMIVHSLRIELIIALTRDCLVSIASALGHAQSSTLYQLLHMRRGIIPHRLMRLRQRFPVELLILRIKLIIALKRDCLVGIVSALGHS